MKSTSSALLGLVAAAALGLCAPARAVDTITFDGLTMSDYTSFSSYLEDGYVFTLVAPNASVPHIGDGTNVPGTLNWHDGYDNGHSAYIQMTRQDGAAFDVSSFDWQTTSVLKVSSGSLSQNFTHGSGTAQLSWTGLSYLNFTTPGYAGIDNVSVAPVTPPVPEPETFALMIAGLGALAFMSRRSKMN